MNRAFPFLVLVLALSGCDERSSPGVIYTADGQFLANNDRNAKLSTEQSIDRSITKELGAHWRCQTHIEELPTRLGGDDDGEWRWRTMTVASELIGDGSELIPIPQAEIERGIDKYCRGKISRGGSVRLTVTTRIEQAAKAGAPSQPSAGKTYTLQAGDTLADISMAFYGTNKNWRLILQANPGLDPEGLFVGQTIIIPPAPKP